MQKHRRIVVGNGMVGHRYLEELVDKADLSQYDVTVFGAEPREAYDRVHLSSYFSHHTAAGWRARRRCWKRPRCAPATSRSTVGKNDEGYFDFFRFDAGEGGKEGTIAVNPSSGLGSRSTFRIIGTPPTKKSMGKCAETSKESWAT